MFYVAACPNQCSVCTVSDETTADDTLFCDSCMEGFVKNDDVCAGSYHCLSCHKTGSRILVQTPSSSVPKIQPVKYTDTIMLQLWLVVDFTQFNAHNICIGAMYGYRKMYCEASQFIYKNTT